MSRGNEIYECHIRPQVEAGDYRQLLEDVEELEAIRAYDAAQASEDEAVALEQALADGLRRLRTCA
jgi:hypothetical protein